jgi:hypothetical protein
MERFRTCEECSRHVRAAESKCPFCGVALDQATLLQVPRGPAQLSRAQRIALVAAVAGGSMLAACGDDAVGMPVYGAPVPRAGAGVAGATAGTGAAGGGAAAGGGTAGRGAAGAPPIAVPVYGAPVPPPAGSSGGAGKAGSGAAGAAGSAGTAGTAGASAGAGGAAGHGMVVPVYGASPAYGVPPSPPPKK